MCNIARLDAFADLWPGASWGPAHVVIEDANLDDANLDSCIRCLEALVSGEHEKLQDWERMFLADWMDPEEKPHVEAEWAATLGFLRMLRALPEDERLEPGDSYCYEETEEGIVAKRDR